MQTHTGNIVDLVSGEIFWGTILVDADRIVSVDRLEKERKGEPYLLPGFIDSHVHIESSLLVPSAFARMAVVHGTVATISDPHEIANVCGMEGIRFMIDDAAKVPFKFHFGAPSCVPATTYETAGATISVQDVDTLLQMPEIHYLSEMMNVPGVLHGDPDVLAKLALAKKYNKPVDGHAPGLRGEAAQSYIAAGIQTDHECFTPEEALDKLNGGMQILIREGSAARNFDALAPLLLEYADRMMFCSDDKHPDSLLEGHINQLCARAIALGVDRMKVLRAACLNPVRHYRMQVGLLQAGDFADFIRVNNLIDFEVLETHINGQLCASSGRSHIQPTATNIINQFEPYPVHPNDLTVSYSGQETIPVIEALDGQLITHRINVRPVVQNGQIIADPTNDLLKIVVVNRYHQAPVAVSFIKNIGIRGGALASSVAHDSHNIVAVGADDEAIAKAVELIMEHRGGLSAVFEQESHILPLPVAGLMSALDGEVVAKRYTQLDAFVKQTMGSPLRAPFMTLSFMALLVIPQLKLSDRGLFDGDTFTWVNGWQVG